MITDGDVVFDSLELGRTGVLVQSDLDDAAQSFATEHVTCTREMIENASVLFRFSVSPERTCSAGQAFYSLESMCHEHVSDKKRLRSVEFRQQVPQVLHHRVP